MKTYQQLDAREAEQFWGKIWQPREHNEKAEWISNLGKKLKGLDERPKAKIHIDSTRTKVKKYQIGKRKAMMAYMDSGSNIHLYP